MKTLKEMVINIPLKLYAMNLKFCIMMLSITIFYGCSSRVCRVVETKDGREITIQDENPWNPFINYRPPRHEKLILSGKKSLYVSRSNEIKLEFPRDGIEKYILGYVSINQVSHEADIRIIINFDEEFNFNGIYKYKN